MIVGVYPVIETFLWGVGTGVVLTILVIAVIVGRGK